MHGAGRAERLPNTPAVNVKRMAFSIVMSSGPTSDIGKKHRVATGPAEVLGGHVDPCQ